MIGARCRAAALLCAMAGAACTGARAVQQAAPELAGLRAAGLRIAVLPFQASAPEQGFLSEALAPVGELLALQQNRALPMRSQLGGLVRGDVIAWLQQSDFDVLDGWHTDTRLTHAGVPAADPLDPSNAPALARALGVDAVLCGDVQRWNRDYYVVQSVAEVGLRLELVDASGRILFVGERSESFGSGIAGGPTGYVSALTEPLAGLSGAHLRELTRSVARNSVIDLNGGELGSFQGPLSPKLTVVGIAAEHHGPFREGERLEVIAIGTPDCEVRFDVGRLRVRVPMQQTARHPDPRGERATYAGHYVIQPGDTAAALPLACTIQRGAARRTVSTWYRWQGTLSLDGSRQ